MAIKDSIMSMKIDQSTRGKSFKTNDFYSAVVLRSLDFPLIDLVPEGSGKKVAFVFDTSLIDTRPEQFLQEYWNGDLQVNAKGFVEAINEVKTRLYDSR